jgi:polysaccharide export outer membrane protein
MTYINVPVAEKLVVVKGAINRPFQYELIDNEGLAELIKYAGGLKANALKSTIQVKRIESDSVRVIDVNWSDLEKSNQKFPLLNGDEITVLEINDLIKNEVSISGAVENPGKYAMTANEKLSDLIKKAKLADHAITSIAYLRRFNDDFKTVRYEFVNLDNIISNPR